MSGHGLALASRESPRREISSRLNNRNTDIETVFNQNEGKNVKINVDHTQI